MTSKSKRMAELFNSSPVRPDKKKRKLEERLQADVGTLQDQTKAMTPQQWKFVTELVDGEGKQTLKQAAIAAGYPENKANKLAHELTDPRQNPQVVAAIQQYRKDLAEKYGTSIERHLRDLQNIRDAALEAGNYGAAVTAEYRRGQALGTIYVDRKEIRHGTIDSMSADEVRRKLEEIKAMYGGPPPQQIIDVTPEEATEGSEDNPDDVELEPSILQGFIDGEKARGGPAPAGEEKSAERGDNSAGEPGGPRSPGLPDRDPERGFRHGGAESGEPGPQGQAESASGGVQSEARDDGPAGVDTGAVPPEGEQ
jgi:phage terminase small subunit